MNEKERMLAGKLFNPYKIHDGSWEKSREALEKFNSLSYKYHKERMQILKKLFGHLEEDAIITPPFYCDKGSQIFIGKHFYANTGLFILDGASVRIGDNVYIGPRVSIYTACHPIDASVRNTDLEYAKSVTIGNDVWIGGNAIINPGVHIGNNVVIGSGSVVTKNIPDDVIAAGNPCKILRKITKEDKKYWEKEMYDYLNDNDIKKGKL